MGKSPCQYLSPAQAVASASQLHGIFESKQPVIISYRTHYPSIDGLQEAGAVCIQADFRPMPACWPSLMT